MSLRVGLLSAAILGFLTAYLASVNLFSVRITLAPGLHLQLPLWALLSGAFLFGALFTVIIVLCRDIRRVFDQSAWGPLLRSRNKNEEGAPAAVQLEPSGEPLSGVERASRHYAAGRQQLEADNCREAVHHFREALREDRGFGPAYLLMGDAYERLGEKREAVRSWERGAEQTTLLPLLLRLEQVSRQEGRPSRMIALYQRALNRVHDDHALAFHLGRVYFELSMLDEAKEQFQKIEAVLPDFPPLHAYLGAILERRGQARQACREYERALQFGRLFEWPYLCSGCGVTSSAWSDQCGVCGRWNSFSPVADSDSGAPSSSPTFAYWMSARTPQRETPALEQEGNPPPREP